MSFLVGGWQGGKHNEFSQNMFVVKLMSCSKLMDASFLLTVEVFLLTVRLFYLPWGNREQTDQTQFLDGGGGGNRKQERPNLISRGGEP